MTTAPEAAQLYEFTSDWFSWNIPVWKQLVAQVNPAKVLEIGSYEGRSAAWLIENCKNPSGLELHCVDPWADYSDLAGKKMSDIEVRFDKNIGIARKQNPSVSIQKHKKMSSIALAELMSTKKNGYFDLVYIDGSHQAPDVLSDAVMSFHLLRVGGVMIFDDYLWHLEPHGTQDFFNMPKPAIDAFLSIYFRKMKIVPETPLVQIYAIKTSE